MPGPDVISNIEEKTVLDNGIKFLSLYDKYSAKVYGFLLSKSSRKDETEELLIKVFVRVWNECNIINENEEKKIILIALSILRSWSFPHANRNTDSSTS